MPPSPSAAAPFTPLIPRDRAVLVWTGAVAAIAAGALAWGAPVKVVGAAAVGGLGLGLGAALTTGSPWGAALGAALWTVSALDTPAPLALPLLAVPWLVTLTPLALRRPDGLAPLGLAFAGLVVMIAPTLAAEGLAGAAGILGAAALSGEAGPAARAALRASGAALCFGALWLVLLPNPEPSPGLSAAPWLWPLGALGMARARHSPHAPALLGLLVTALTLKIGPLDASALLTVWASLSAANLVGKAGSA